MPLAPSGAGSFSFTDRLPILGSTGGIGLELSMFVMVEMVELAMWALWISLLGIGLITLNCWLVVLELCNGVL